MVACESLDRDHQGATDLADVLTISGALAQLGPAPQADDMLFLGTPAARRMKLDAEGLRCRAGGIQRGDRLVAPGARSMSTTEATTVESRALPNTVVFAFVKSLASELSQGRVELPSVPDVVLRLQKTLSDEFVTNDTVVRVIGSEPMLAARLMTMANSAALNASGAPHRRPAHRRGARRIQHRAFGGREFRRRSNCARRPSSSTWKRSSTRCGTAACRWPRCAT